MLQSYQATGDYDLQEGQTWRSVKLSGGPWQSENSGRQRSWLLPDMPFVDQHFSPLGLLQQRVDYTPQRVRRHLCSCPFLLDCSVCFFL